MAEIGSELGRLNFEVTQAGLDEILLTLSPENRIAIPPLQAKAGILGKLKLDGTVIVSDYRLRVEEEGGVVSARVAGDFTFAYDPPRGDPIQAPLEVSFRIPDVTVTLRGEGTRVLMVLNDIQWSMELKQPRRIPEAIWKRIAERLERLASGIRGIVNAELKKRPVQLFDLGSSRGIPLAEGKLLHAAPVIDELAFRGSSLHCAVRFLKTE